MKIVLLVGLIGLIFSSHSCTKRDEVVLKSFKAQVFDPETNLNISGVQFGIWESEFDGQVVRKIGGPVYTKHTDANGSFELDKKLRSSSDGYMIDIIDSSYQFTGPEYINPHRLIGSGKHKDSKKIAVKKVGNLQVNTTPVCSPTQESNGMISIFPIPSLFTLPPIHIRDCGLKSFDFTRIPIGEYKLLLISSKGSNSSVQEKYFNIELGKTTKVNLSF
jgi:hypothetical protein